MNSDLLNKENYFLQPGYIFASREPHIISTVLGSCVSVCVWDPLLNFGGMNHYIHSKPFKKSESTAQYGSVSVPYLIKMLTELGASKHNLKAHIVGGACHSSMNNCIGKDNVAIAESILKKHYIEIVTMDIGGDMGRKVVFDSKTGEILICKVNSLRKSDWYVH